MGHSADMEDALTHATNSDSSTAAGRIQRPTSTVNGCPLISTDRTRPLVPDRGPMQQQERAEQQPERQREKDAEQAPLQHQRLAKDFRIAERAEPKRIHVEGEQASTAKQHTHNGNKKNKQRPAQGEGGLEHR